VEQGAGCVQPYVDAEAWVGHDPRRIGFEVDGQDDVLSSCRGFSPHWRARAATVEPDASRRADNRTLSAKAEAVVPPSVTCTTLPLSYTACPRRRPISAAPHSPIVTVHGEAGDAQRERCTARLWSNV
jgi:hypothetical protein